MDNCSETLNFGKENPKYQLQSFSDRIIPTRIFLTALHEDDYDKILFFHGSGGNGKSLLLLYLNQHFKKKFKDNEVWLKYKTLSDVDLIKSYLSIKDSDKQIESIPSVFIDFDQSSTLEYQPKNPLSVARYIRKELSKKNLKFPLFDYAYVLYLYKTRNLSENNVRDVLCDSGIDLVNELIGIFYDMPGAGVVLKTLKKLYGNRILVELKKLGVNDKEILEELHSMDPNGELADILPTILAIDLVESMKAKEAPSRVIMFFDTHESFWENNRDVSDYDYFQKDEWLRTMLNVFQQNCRIVTVMAGREKPKWHEAHTRKISKKRIEAHLIGHLTKEDANEVLEKKGITDKNMREAIIKYTEVEPNEVHPLYLRICADTVLVMEKNGNVLSPKEFEENVPAEVLGEKTLTRFLRYVSRTTQSFIIALSVCRGFNYSIFNTLGKALNFNSDEPTFDLILEYSFVKHLSDGSYQIHQLVRKLVEEMTEDIDSLDMENENVDIAEKTKKMIYTAKKAKETLETYYREKGECGDFTAKAEAIYYANQIDKERGIKEWIEAFSTAMDKKSQWDLCGALSNISVSLKYPDDFTLAEITRLKGKYYSYLSSYSNAEANFLSALDIVNDALKESERDSSIYLLKGNIMKDFGDMLARRSEFKEAENYFKEAVEAYDVALSISENDARVYCGKGEMLSLKGYMQFRQSMGNEAKSSYLESVDSCEKAIDIDCNYAEAYMWKGSALYRLIDIKTDIDCSKKAFSYCESAIACHNEALRLEPNNVDALYRKGNCFVELGTLYNEVANQEEAKKKYDEAFECYSQALELASDDVDVNMQVGNARKSLARLQIEWKQLKESEETILMAINYYDKVLKIAPTEPWTIINKGTAYTVLGEIKQLNMETIKDKGENGEYNKFLEEAKNCFNRAVLYYNEAILISPNEAWTHSFKGMTLQKLGILHDNLEEYEKARAYYNEAIACFEKAIIIAPQLDSAINDIGDTLKLIGDLNHKFSDMPVDQYYKQAIACYDKSIDIVPNSLYPFFQKGYVLIDLGDIQTKYTESIEQHYRLAIASFDNALLLKNDDIGTHTARGWALLRLGTRLCEISRYADALQEYHKALDSFNMVLKIDETNSNALNNKVWLAKQIAKLERRDKLMITGLEEPEAENRVPLEINWQPVDSEVKHEILSFMGNALSENQVSLQSVSVPFYEKFRLCKLISETIPSKNSLYFLYMPGNDPIIIDWTNEPIYSLNENAPVILNKDTVIPYAKFFFNFVRASIGQFIIVEKPEDILWLPEATPKEKEEVNSRLIPVTYQGIDDKGFFSSTCTVIFKNALFKTEIKIAPQEMDVIVEETGENEHFTIGQIKLENEEPLCEELNVPYSPISTSSDTNIDTSLFQGLEEPEAENRVPLKINWQPVDSEVKREILSLTGNALSENQVSLQSVSVPFYEKFRLCKLISETIPSKNSLYFLYMPGNDPIIIDWTNEPIYSLNENAPVILNKDTVIPYAKFFFNFVRASIGQFIIVEKPEDILWLPEATPKEKEEVNSRLIPVTYQGIDDKGFFSSTCTVIFKNALFKTEIKIAPQEMDVIVEETGENEHFTIGQIKLENEELLCEELNVPYTPIPISNDTKRH
jgi:tetratricopeptide (TPR) repeat protein